MRFNLKKLNSFTLKTSKNHLIRNFLRKERLRVNCQKRANCYKYLEDKADLVNFPMKENGLQTQKIDCFVAGWGYRQENKWTSLPDILQDAQVHLLYNETCEATYTDIDNNGEPVSEI